MQGCRELEVPIFLTVYGNKAGQRSGSTTTLGRCQRTWTATGFLVKCRAHETPSETTTRYYLVTCSHAYADANRDDVYDGEIVTIWFKSHNDFQHVNMHLRRATGEPIYVEHTNEDVDLTALEVPSKFADSGLVVEEMTDLDTGTETCPTPGSSVSVPGYPRRKTRMNWDTRFPLVKGGFISTPVQKGYQSLPLFLIESPSPPPGYAGSVVFHRSVDQSRVTPLGVYGGLWRPDALGDLPHNFVPVWQWDAVESLMRTATGTAIVELELCIVKGRSKRYSARSVNHGESV